MFSRRNPAMPPTSTSTATAITSIRCRSAKAMTAFTSGARGGAVDEHGAGGDDLVARREPLDHFDHIAGLAAHLHDARLQQPVVAHHEHADFVAFLHDSRFRDT